MGDFVIVAGWIWPVGCLDSIACSCSAGLYH